MPLVRDVEVLFSSEYDRFMTGLRGLSPEGQAQARANAYEARRGPSGTFTIAVPRTGDIFHFSPRVAVTPDERSAHFAALRAGQPSPLSQEQKDELARRRRVSAAIRDSATPEYAQSFGQMLTAIDNIQDFFSTVSTVGRLALWSAKWIAPKLVARAVPGIGMVLLASDLLNLLGFFGQLAIPFYGLYCGHYAGVLPGTVPALLFGRALKAQVWSLANLNPFSRKARLARRLRSMPGFLQFGGALGPKGVPFLFEGRTYRGYGKFLTTRSAYVSLNTTTSIRGSVANLVEVAQTTDQMWGRGISFGAIVGFITGGAYGIERLSRGEKVVVKSLKSEHDLHKLLHPKLALLSDEEIQDRQRAAHVLIYAPFILRRMDLWDDQLIAQTMISVLGAVDLLGRDLRGSGWQEFLSAEPVDVFLPPEPPLPVFSGLRDEGDVAPGDFTTWPLPDQLEALTFPAWLQVGAEDLPQALRKFLEPRRNDITGMMFGALVDAMTNRLWLLLEEDPDLFKFELTPQWRALSSLAESNRVVNIGQDEQSIVSFWAEAESLHQDVGDGPKTGSEWDALAEKHGLSLLKLRAP